MKKEANKDFLDDDGENTYLIFASGDPRPRFMDFLEENYFKSAPLDDDGEYIINLDEKTVPVMLKEAYRLQVFGSDFKNYTIENLIQFLEVFMNSYNAEKESEGE